MEVGDLAKKVLSNLGMAVNEKGEPRIDVFDVQWQEDTWWSEYEDQRKKPGIILSRKGDIDINHGNGGFVNGIWKRNDAKKRKVAGYPVGGGTFDSEGELSGYRGGDNGYFSGPDNLEKEFRAPLLVQICIGMMSPEEMEIFSLLDEGPETWDGERLIERIVSQINQEVSSEVADFIRLHYQKEGYWFDDSDLEELIEVEMGWIWERIEGFSGMDLSEVRHEMEVSLYADIPDQTLSWLSEVSSHVQINGLPDGFALIRDMPTKSVRSGHYLLYGRTGFHGDPDAPTEDWEIRDILHSIDPIEYPEYIELDSTPETLEKNGWWFAEVPSGKLLLDERSRYEKE